MYNIKDNFSLNLPTIMETQKYLSPTAFSMLIRIYYYNLQDIVTISGIEFQDLCNISRNTVTKIVDELQDSSCVSVKRFSRVNSKYMVDINGCASFVKEELIKEIEYENDCEKTELTQNPRVYIKSSMRKLIFERDLYRCINCGTHKDLSVDHIVPVSKGGGNEIKNLQTLCLPCNSSKGAKSMSEWLEIGE